MFTKDNAKEIAISIQEECKKHDDSCLDCPLFIDENVGCVTNVMDKYKFPDEWDLSGLK